MLDLRRIREDPDGVRTALARRGPGVAERIDEVLELDGERRAAITSAENLRSKQKSESESLAAAQRAGEDVGPLRASLKDLSARVKELTTQAAEADERLQGLLRTLPNLTDPSAPPEDEVLRVVGEPANPVAEPRDHLELAGDRIDMERAARMSGSRFAYLRGELVLLELALVRWALDVLGRHGFQPVIPPVLVREQALFGTGMLPDPEQQIYHVPADDLYLVGTSEVALASLHAEEVLDAADLPVRYAGFSPCFRREAGAAGRDTRGLFRVHQFDKVEMFSFVAPEESPTEHQLILSIEEEILQALGVPYRVVNIAADDLGASAAKKFDLEAWLPGQGRYRELTSCSNTTDFQARRLDIRMRPAGGRPEVLHTLNGTAVAVGRTIIALLENGQHEDGSVQLPEVLVPYGAPAVLAPAHERR
jgi:seryl-tRNA synthetase